MTGFVLDTSGFVEGPPAGIRTKRIYWKDLPNDFVRGYTAKVLEEADAAFHQLAGETLATILRDCEALYKAWPGVLRLDGADAWKLRQAGQLDDFPSQHPTIDDEGKVRF